MNQISNQKDIDRIAKKAVDALYGSNIQDFKNPISKRTEKGFLGHPGDFFTKWPSIHS